MGVRIHEEVLEFNNKIGLTRQFTQTRFDDTQLLVE